MWSTRLLLSRLLCDCSQAFKNYDEAGNVRRVQCLKYMVLANMLMESNVDPFDAQEAKPYKQDPEVRGEEPTCQCRHIA